jgi:membrane-associated phospholipid phosphatase
MIFHNSIQVIEPMRGQQLMIAINSWIVKHHLLVTLLPWTADIFVFTYPIYLVGLYLRGVSKHRDYYKHASFAIAFSAWSAAIVNALIQYFGDKSRPETAISLKQNLILDHLPTDPFPSDHAAVSAAIAMSTLLRWLKHKDKDFLKVSLFFWFACGVMSFSRVAVAIHWPTDILAWLTVGILSALLILQWSVWQRLVRHICTPLIAVQEWIFKKLWWSL